jgi:hypothetical protein
MSPLLPSRLETGAQVFLDRSLYRSRAMDERKLLKTTLRIRVHELVAKELRNKNRKDDGWP